MLSPSCSYDVTTANDVATVEFPEADQDGDDNKFDDFRQLGYQEPFKWNVYRILVHLIVTQGTITIVLKIIAGILIINYNVSCWKIFHRFHSGEVDLPDGEAQLNVTIAIGFFTALGVLTGLLMLWDMIIETLEEFGRAGYMKGIRIQPYHELWIILLFEEMPQSIIRLCVLIYFSVKEPSDSWLNLLYNWESVVIPDVVAVCLRFSSSITRLYMACEPGIRTFCMITKPKHSFDEVDFRTRKLIKRLNTISRPSRPKLKSEVSAEKSCWHKIAILMAVIADIVLMVALVAISIAYVVLKSKLK